MCSIYLFPGGSGQTLHALITATQQYSAEDVDEKMDAGVHSLDVVAVAGVEQALVLFRGDRAPDRDSEIQRTDDKCTYREIQDADSPPAGATVATTEPGPSSRHGGIVLCG
jgi:hypothetical protein